MKRSKSVNLVVVPLLAAAFLAGCGNEEKETAYCVDQENKVTDNDNCDRGNNSSFFWFFGAAGLGRGSFAPSGGERINSTDKAALAKRGGFGSSARSGGIGRPTGKTIGGGGFSGGS